MIITVTLNAAIDKSLSVPNFRLGRRHRAVEQTHDAGRQGRQRRPRAQDARPARDRDRASPAARPARASSSSSPRSRSSTTSCASARSRAPTPRCIDPTSGEQTEINERGPEVTAEEVELFRDKLLYLASGARRSSSSPGSLPRGVEPTIYAELIRELQQARSVTTVVDAEGEPMRQAVRAEPDGRLAERRARPRSSSATSSRRRGPIARSPSRELCELGAARGDHHAARRLRRARRRRRAPAASSASGSSRARRSPTVGAGDAFLAGYVAARYAGSLAGGVPALRRRLRRRVDAALRRRPDRSRARSSGCSPRSTSSASRPLQRPSEPRSGRARRRAAGGVPVLCSITWPLPPATPRRSLSDPVCAGSFRPPTNVGSTDGN